MSPRDAIAVFWTLCQEATKAWDRTPDTKKYEPAFLKVLEYVQQNNHVENEFRKAFIQIINNPDLAIWEIVMYCMRELRWQEVLEAAKNRLITTVDIKTKDIMEKIIAVFEEEWEDSDLFEHFSK